MHGGQALSYIHIERNEEPSVTLAGACENFLYVFKGAPPARQAGAEPGPDRMGKRGSHRGGSRAAARGMPPEPSREQGDSPFRGGQPAAPYGRKPSGRGAAASPLSPLPQGGRSRQPRAHRDRAA